MISHTASGFTMSAVLSVWTLLTWAILMGLALRVRRLTQIVNDKLGKQPKIKSRQSVIDRLFKPSAGQHPSADRNQVWPSDQF